MPSSRTVPRRSSTREPPSWQEARSPGSPLNRSPDCSHSQRRHRHRGHVFACDRLAVVRLGGRRTDNGAIASRGGNAPGR